MLFLNKRSVQCICNSGYAGQSFTSCGGESVDVVGPVAFLSSESSSSLRRIQDLPGILYPFAYASMETVLFFRCSISCCS